MLKAVAGAAFIERMNKVGMAVDVSQRREFKEETFGLITGAP